MKYAMLNVCVTGLTQFDLSSEELDRLQNRKWKLASMAATRIHPSSSEPVLGATPGLRTRGGGGRGRGRETGSETTVRDAFQLLSLSIARKPPQGTG